MGDLAPRILNLDTRQTSASQSSLIIYLLIYLFIYLFIHLFVSDWWQESYEIFKLHGLINTSIKNK